jgi:hypothetical protein
MYEHITTASLPGLPTADKIGAGLAIATAAGTAIHLTASAVRKALHKRNPSEPSQTPPQEA